MSSILKQDIVLSLHSDTPVGVPSPLDEVWTAVNRIGELSGKTHAPAERVRKVERAMKMVTIDAAYTLGVNAIKDIKVIATITGDADLADPQSVLVV